MLLCPDCGQKKMTREFCNGIHRDIKLCNDCLKLDIINNRVECVQCLEKKTTRKFTHYNRHKKAKVCDACVRINDKAKGIVVPKKAHNPDPTGNRFIEGLEKGVRTL